jgi:hypothetical protein
MLTFEVNTAFTSLAWRGNNEDASSATHVGSIIEAMCK